MEGAGKGEIDKVEILADAIGVDKESFEKAVAERANCVVASIRKELLFWKSVAEQQQGIIAELEQAQLGE